MITLLDNLLPVDMNDPVNREHPLNRGRVGWWLAPPDRFGGGTLYDLMGLNHGALTSFGAGYGWKGDAPPGGFNSLLFNGGQSVVIPNSPSLVAQSTITIATWVKVAGSGQIISKDNATARPWAVSANPAGTIRFFLSNASNTLVVLDGATAINAPIIWHHIACTYDGSTMRLYIDGKLDASIAQSGAISPGTSTVQIGSREYSGSPDYFLSGSVSGASVWNRALPAQEVVELYNVERTGYAGVLNRWQQRSLDAPSGSTAWTKTLTESLSLTDGRTSGVARILAETLSLSDGRLSTTAKVLAESLSLTDARSARSARILAETLTLTDIRAANLARVLADTLSLSDSVLTGAGLAKLLIETLSLSDSLSKSAAFVRALAETLVLVDVRSAGLARKLAETYGLTDTVAAQIVVLATLVIVSASASGDTLISTSSAGDILISTDNGGIA